MEDSTPIESDIQIERLLFIFYKSILFNIDLQIQSSILKRKSTYYAVFHK